jgi:energy-coupling factor transporter ATP-binding protein EcfA2
VADAPQISVRGLSYWYPKAERPALDEIDLEVRKGEFILFVGTSGSGKSTLLRSFNGLVPRYYGGQYRGNVDVDDLNASQGPSVELASRIGLVFQDPERQAVMSRVDNEVAFGLECLGMPSREIGVKVHDALSAVGLEHRRTDMVSELSSGQSQRLALADVLAMEPDILALDEPTSQLDPEAAEEFLNYLDHERRERGVTVLLAEHRLDKSVLLADRVVVLQGGRITFDGPPSEFLSGQWDGSEDLVMTTLAQVFKGSSPPPMEVEDARERFAQLHSDGRLHLHREERGARGEVLARLDGVRFTYETGPEVLRGVDLELRAGEAMVIVGPNGSGKTTLARHLNGLLRPSKGRVLLEGEDTADQAVSNLANRVALLTQNPSDYLFERSVEAELFLTAEYRGLTQEEASHDVDDVMHQLGLEGFMKRFSWDLSVGQRQRVALGALLVGAPRMLVLDEPTRGMDGAHKASLAGMARELAASGKAVVVITHDQEFAAQVADRYVVLEEGTVVVEGPPHRVFEKRPTYSPVLWRATEGLDIPPEQRPLGPGDVSIDGEGPAGGGVSW